MIKFQAWFTGLRWEVDEILEEKNEMPIAHLFDSREEAEKYAALMNGEAE